MASQFDESDFVDADYQSERGAYGASPAVIASATHPVNRPPSREELEVKVSDTQQKLSELKRAQEQLERERAALEEARRRRIEFQTGREEMLHHLTRGIGLLGEAEFAARRDAEQMAKTLAGLQDVLAKVQSIQEDSWNQENWNVELTRALTAIENARMEWNAAQLKWQVLGGGSASGAKSGPSSPSNPGWPSGGFLQMCKYGFALSWPIALVGFLGVVLAVFLALSR